MISMHGGGIRFRPQYIRKMNGKKETWYPCTKNTPQSGPISTQNQEKMACFPDFKKSQRTRPSTSKGLFFPAGYPVLALDTMHVKTPIRALDTNGRVQYQYNAKAKATHRKKHWEHMKSCYKPLWKALNLTSNGYPSKLITKTPPSPERWTDDDTAFLIVTCAIRCGFRPGNEKYKKANGSFGLMTIEWQHVKVTESNVKFDFIGKKGVENLCACDQASPEEKKFRKWWKAYTKYAKSNHWIQSNQPVWRNKQSTPFQLDYIQEYIQNLTSCPEITWKDIRTFCVNWWMMDYLAKHTPKDWRNPTKKEQMQVWRFCLEQTAHHFHHTPTVCQSSYLHPAIKQWYEKSYHPTTKRRWMELVFTTPIPATVKK